MDTREKWLEVKRAWAIWNLLDELQERLWMRYENEFLELTRRRYNPEQDNKKREQS